jgi:hypothetical protein
MAGSTSLRWITFPNRIDQELAPYRRTFGDDDLLSLTYQRCALALSHCCGRTAHDSGDGRANEVNRIGGDIRGLVETCSYQSDHAGRRQRGRGKRDQDPNQAPRQRASGSGIFALV